mmetsp:Transcript_511/g.1212  ORF Transcript_511/g.1212 Transcript_511/m.1212 type:complete len:200 (-) Transcript_511:98-697(-)
MVPNCSLNVFFICVILYFLITGSGESLVDFRQFSCSGLLSLCLKSSCSFLLLEESLRLGSALVLKTVNEFLVLPTDVVRKISKLAEVSSRLETNNTECGRDDLTLHLIIRVGNSLKSGETPNSGLSAGSLLVNHTTDGPPNNTSWRPEVEGTTFRIGVHVLRTELSILGLVADKGSRDDHLLATDKNNLLTSQKLLGHN